MDAPEQLPESMGDSKIKAGYFSTSSSQRETKRDSSLHSFAILLSQWFQENSFTPQFLTHKWSHPLIGYLVAPALQVGMVLVFFSVVHILPAFHATHSLEGLFALVILLVALGWGAGPSLIALLAGAGLLVFLVFPPLFSLQVTYIDDTISLCIYGVVGLTISLLTSRTERSRRTSERLRIQLDTIIEAIPDSLTIYDLDGQPIQQNRVARQIGLPAYPLPALADRPSELSIRSLSGTLLPQEALPLFRALQGETVQGTELVYRFPATGQECLVSVSAAPLHAPSDQTVVGAVAITHDVSARKHMEDALRASEERYRTIVQTANEGIWLTDTNAQLLYVNERMTQLFAASAEEMVGHPILEFVFPDDQAEGRLHIDNNLQGKFEQFDFRFRRKDATTLHALVCTSPMRNESGCITGMLAMLTDVTERVRAAEQEQLLAVVSKVLSSTLDYQQTLANIAQVIVPQLADWFAVDLVDEQGNFDLIEVAHANPAMVQWARVLREKYPIDPHAPTGVPHVVRSGQSELYPDISDDLLVATTKTEEELTIARQIGYTSVIIVPLVAQGKTLGAMTFVAAESGRRYDERDLVLAEDIGRRAGVALDNARLYREAAQARDQLDIILQGVADGIIVYGPASQIIYANEAAAQLTGEPSAQHLLKTSEGEIVNRYEIIDEQGQPFPPSQFTHMRVFAGETQAQAIFGYSDKVTGQSGRWSLVKSRPVHDEKGKAMMAITIIHDITERVQAEQRKDEFISMASHELKTPVTSLKGFTHILQRRLSKLGDDQGLHFLSRMDAQLNKLTKLINDILDVSRMQTGKLSLKAEPVDLNALVQETVENVQAATITHQFLLEGTINGLVLGDPDRLGQVLINLLTNAVKYSPEAKIVRVYLADDREQATIKVQDFGIGIDPSQHQKIFERFYQVTDPEERTYPGLGMGLYISSEIVARHQGKMWVESRKGAGSTFAVTWPLLRKNENENEESPS